jgi:hypothetical protein
VGLLGLGRTCKLANSSRTQGTGVNNGKRMDDMKQMTIADLGAWARRAKSIDFRLFGPVWTAQLIFHSLNVLRSIA